MGSRDSNARPPLPSHGAAAKAREHEGAAKLEEGECEDAVRRDRGREAERGAGRRWGVGAAALPFRHAASGGVSDELREGRKERRKEGKESKKEASATRL